jgi:uncharacterized protein
MMPRIVEGYASTFGNVDQHRDIVMPGAFTRTLEHLARKGKAIRLLDQHRQDSIGRVIGQSVHLEEDDAGLFARFELLDDDPAADAAWRRITAGMIDSFSIGYQAVRSRPAKGTRYRSTGATRLLDEVKLVEVSAVIAPSNEEALISRASGKARILRASDGHKTYHLAIERAARCAKEAQRRETLDAVERALSRVAGSDSDGRKSAARTTRGTANGSGRHHPARQARTLRPVKAA